MKKNKKDKSLSETKQESKVKKFFKNVFEVLSKKWLVNGATTILLVAIIFAIYFGVTALLKKVNLPEFDLTKDKVYSLSEETKTKVGELDKDVKITLINYGSNDTMKNIVNKYKSLNKKITVEEIDDLTSRQDLAQEYSLKSTDSLIIVTSGEKKTTVTSSDLVTYDYSTYKQIDTTEEAITNAIVDVTSDTKPNVYFLSNHEMYGQDAYETITKTIKDDANEVKTLDLLSEGKVPDDCNCLVITTLKEDITQPERDYIKAYINNGGKLLLLCGANLTTSLPNFDEILSLYGLSLEQGIVLEGKSDNMISQYPEIVVENVSANSTTKNMDMNLKACLVDATAIDITTDTDTLNTLGVQYETLVTTSTSAFLRKDISISTASRTENDGAEKSYTLGVLATKKIDDNKTSKLIMYSDEAFPQIQLGNYLITASNNKDIVANSISYLNERTDTITIRKNYDDVTYTTVTQKQHNIIIAIIFLTPLAIIIVGIVIWQVRKRRNK